MELGKGFQTEASVGRSFLGTLGGQVTLPSDHLDAIDSSYLLSAFRPLGANLHLGSETVGIRSGTAQSVRSHESQPIYCSRFRSLRMTRDGI